MVAPPKSDDVPESLKHEDLRVVWQAARNQLDRFGEDRRGKVSMPSLSDSASMHLSSLLGSVRLTTRLDLAQLESALVSLDIEKDLDRALTRLGAPPCVQRREERAQSARRESLRDAMNEHVRLWPEPWTRQWSDWLFQSGQMAGLDQTTAMRMLKQVRQLLDRWRAGRGTSEARNDLAASVCGSAHALDDGQLLERCTRRALWYALDGKSDYHNARAVWIAAGIYPDRVSAPVLAWNLPLDRQSVLGAISSAATSAAVPLHLPAMAFDRHNIIVDSANPVLLIENPRLVEAAAERKLDRCVISTNGNPSTAVMQLVQGLLQSGVVVRNHNDFDSAGIGICRRMAELGCTPWYMGAADYLQALEFAADNALQLPCDTSETGSTPWDPELQYEMNIKKSIVHEELLLDNILRTLLW